MRQTLRELKRVAHRRDGTIWLAENPLRGRQEVASTGACVVTAVAEGLRAVALGIVQNNALLEMGQSRERIAHVDQRRPEGVVGLQETSRALFPLRDLQQLVAQLAGRRVLPATQVDEPQPPERLIEANRIAQPLRRLIGAPMRRLDLRRADALDSGQRRAEP